MRTKARTIQNQRRSEGQRTFLEGQTQQSTKNGPLPEKEPSLTHFLVFSSFSGLLPHATCLRKSIWKDENIYQHIPFLCHDRTEGRPGHGRKTVFATPVTGRIQDSKLLFPFLRSAALLVTPSQTLQRWGPRLNDTPLQVTGLSPIYPRVEQSPLALTPDLSPQKWKDSEACCSTRHTH